MDVVRLAALAATDPDANGFRASADGMTFLPTEAANPAVCIPSTIGTASEVSPVAVRTSRTGTALVVSPGLRARAAIIEPQMTATLPPAALGAGLVEPLARTCVPAVAGEWLRFQDGMARGLTATILSLGDDLVGTAPDEGWRAAAALASTQTHLGLLALGRAPAGHLLWPLATEVARATELPKTTALAALVPAWLRCVASGAVGRGWGSAERVDEILGVGPAEAAERLDSWLRALSLPTLLPATIDLDAVVARVVDPWQASGLFLPGVASAEIATVVSCASAAGSGR
jgi:alcohol dehydrogenase class IV